MHNNSKAMLFSVAFAASFASHAAPARVAPPVDRVEQATSYFLRPAIGEVSTAEVGESLYKEGIRTVSKRYQAVLKAGGSSKMDRGYVLTVKAGYGGQMLVRGGIPMLCFTTENTGVVGFFGDRNVLGCLADIGKNQEFTRSLFPHYAGMFPVSAPIPYEVSVTETETENPDDFFVDVLYQGTSKGEVKISYREYSHGIARPAFTQDVSYELQKDGTAAIGFKGMRIKVLKATGQDIQYILEQPMPSMTKYRAESGRENVAAGSTGS
ncbi:hypothetical protein LK540_07890 [Massilia sp. IC2-278]|uniref:hypothetical protein n=1 Tax=Massilia sp. IC2-278 TaxID=2887200 RepID=UPI001E633361|nr:hypothetical protein [Massilia sp. IC2-278]MCC2960350.1 hypothetical protein [Massilia sp. IC2-278]